MRRSDKNKLGGFIAGLLIGGIAAGTTAILYTPVSGKKLRKKINRAKEDLVEDMNEYIETGKEYFADKRKRAEEMITQAKSRMSTPHSS